MRRVAGQYDHASGGKSPHLVAVEPIAEADVEHARHDRVDPVFRMPVRHEFGAGGHLHSDDVRAWFGRMSDEDCKPRRGRKRWKRFPVDVFREYRFENGLVWLVRARHNYFSLEIEAVKSIHRSSPASRLAVTCSR